MERGEASVMVSQITEDVKAELISHQFFSLIALVWGDFTFARC